MKQRRSKISTIKKITVSKTAVQQLKKLAQQEKQPKVTLRVAVDGGGCSGFQYSFTFDDKVNEDDHLIETDGTEVVIDKLSWEHLAGSEISYNEELIGSFFTINNPNATSTCGCGTSFAVM